MNGRNATDATSGDGLARGSKWQRLISFFVRTWRKPVMMRRSGPAPCESVRLPAQYASVMKSSMCLGGCACQRRFNASSDWFCSPAVRHTPDAILSVSLARCLERQAFRDASGGLVPMVRAVDEAGAHSLKSTDLRAIYSIPRTADMTYLHNRTNGTSRRRRSHGMMEAPTTQMQMTTYLWQTGS